MISRYMLRFVEAGCEVYDSQNHDETVFGPALWSDASRKAAELNGRLPQPAALRRLRDLVKGEG